MAQSRIEEDDLLYAKLDAKHIALKHVTQPFPPDRGRVRDWAYFAGYGDYLEDFMKIYDYYIATRTLPIIRF